MQIVVRVRPVLPHEASQQVAVTCSSDGSSVQVVLPEREFSKPAIAASAKPDAKAYEFDACLTGSTTQVGPSSCCSCKPFEDAPDLGCNLHCAWTAIWCQLLALASTGGITAHICTGDFCCQLMQRRQRLEEWLHAASQLSATTLHGLSSACAAAEPAATAIRAMLPQRAQHQMALVPCLCLLVQAELFDLCGISDLVEAAVDGYNVTGESAIHWEGAALLAACHERTQWHPS